MNLVNRAMGGVFNVLMTPFEALGVQFALIFVSGLVGIVCLILFKFISWQDGIKRVKDRIKGSMIAIRIYQDDLAIVAKSVLSVFLRNFQYLGLNFGPILPLLVPFVLVLSQFVVRYAYDPLPVVSQAELSKMMPGDGTLIEVQLKRGQEEQVRELALELPDGLQALSPIVRSPSTGKAFLEVAATKPVRGELKLTIDGREVGSKEVAAGAERPRLMQPVRTASFWAAWLYPAEDMLPADGPVASIEFAYPDRDLGFLPGGEMGILLVFFLASLVFGAAVLKPLKIQI